MTNTPPPPDDPGGTAAVEFPLQLVVVDVDQADVVTIKAWADRSKPAHPLTRFMRKAYAALPEPLRAA